VNNKNSQGGPGAGTEEPFNAVTTTTGPDSGAAAEGFSLEDAESIDDLSEEQLSQSLAAVVLPDFPDASTMTEEELDNEEFDDEDEEEDDDAEADSEDKEDDGIDDVSGDDQLNTSEDS
jgi:hypothetical protein